VAAVYHILIVDDNRDGAESLAQLLRRAGHEVRTAYDGTTALGIANTFHPETVLLDIHLPMLSGFELAQRLRQQPGLEKTKLIALSSSPKDENRQLSHQVDFDLRLLKPVDPQTLKDALDSVHHLDK
jgi:CheY-like chemotaxis protein